MEGKYGKTFQAAKRSFVLMFFALCSAIASSCSSSLNSMQQKPATRDLSESDFSITTSQGVSDYSVAILARSYIITVTVSIRFLDSSGKAIGADSGTKGPLARGDTAVFTFGMDWNELWNTRYANYSCYGTVRND